MKSVDPFVSSFSKLIEERKKEIESGVDVEPDIEYNDDLLQE